MSLAITPIKLTSCNFNLLAKFLGELASGETISSASAASTVYSGVDASPSTLLSGSPVVLGTSVMQKLTGGVGGVIYQVAITAVTSLGNHLTQIFLIAVSYSDETATPQLNTVLAGTPIASFTYVVTDLSVAFTDASTDVNGTISAWAWSFGDGNTSTSQNPTHVYTTLGDFAVTLTITDSYSGIQDSIAQTVTIDVGGLVDPPGYDDGDYNTSQRSPADSASARLTFTMLPNGTWSMVNKADSILDSGNWFYPTIDAVGVDYTAEFTVTLGTTGTYWTLTNPAASATSLAAPLILIMDETSIVPSTDDFTDGTVKIDIAGLDTSTGTFDFSVAIITSLHGGGP